MNGEKESSKRLLRDTELADSIDSICHALNSEISAAKSDTSRAFNVINGTKVHGDEHGHLYSFKAEVATPIPPETPIQLVIDDSGIFKGVFVAIEDFDILIKLQLDAGENIRKAKITSEPWFIYDTLRKRLEEALYQTIDDDRNPRILLGFLDILEVRNEEAIEKSLRILNSLNETELHPNKEQQSALRSCLSSNLRFIWGPPGTGKTASLAQVVRSYVANNETVLVLAHANAAVDVAMDRVAKVFTQSEELSDGKVLRVGVPQLPEVLENEFILP
jgi:hypothetical protein